MKKVWPLIIKPTLLALVISLIALPSGAASEAPISAPPERSYSAFDDAPSRRFDFWIGRWSVNLRSRQSDLSWAPLATATAHIYSILDGKAVLELWDSESIKGFSLRYFDPERQEWVLWLNWPNPSTGRAFLRGLTGRFRHGRAVFEGEHQQPDGTRITTRYTFSDITPFSLRWHDKYSRDGGETWRPNWIMEFTREAVEAEWPIAQDAAPTVDAGPRCQEAPYKMLEPLAGRWVASGANEYELQFWEILNGCAVIALLEADQIQRFLFLSYNSFRNSHELSVLDSRAGTGLRRYFGNSFEELEGDDGTWRLRTGKRDSIELVIGDQDTSQPVRFQRAHSHSP